VDDAGEELGTCEAPRTPAAGQPCFNGRCAAGLWCNQAPTLVPGTCADPSAAGGPCLAGDDTTCASGLTCNGGTHTCQTPSTAGGPCSADWIKTCVTGLGCGAGKTCEAKVADGAACDASAVCPAGDYCDVTCKPTKPSGATCTGQTGECQNGSCDRSAHVCNGSCVDPG
jgi:hypothetical protein